MSLIEITDHRGNPLEVVERMASTNDWSFERAGEDEITILVRGKWTDYQVSFTWMDDIEALHLACAFEIKTPERCRAEVQLLTALVNEQMWVGHFDFWGQDGTRLCWPAASRPPGDSARRCWQQRSKRASATIRRSSS
jgi:hypothetical protein